MKTQFGILMCLAAFVISSNSSAGQTVVVDDNIELVPDVPFLGDYRATIKQVDNAVAYGSLGIIVGTTEIVPEPTSASMLAAGLVVIAGLRRLHRVDI